MRRKTAGKKTADKKPKVSRFAKWRKAIASTVRRTVRGIKKAVKASVRVVKGAERGVRAATAGISRSAHRSGAAKRAQAKARNSPVVEQKVRPNQRPIKSGFETRIECVTRNKRANVKAAIKSVPKEITVPAHDRSNAKNGVKAHSKKTTRLEGDAIAAQNYLSMSKPPSVEGWDVKDRGYECKAQKAERKQRGES
jgi:hypothetical protein